MTITENVTIASAEQPARSKEKTGEGKEEVTSVDSAESQNSDSRKFGTIVTIVGSALANLSDGFQQHLASATNVIFKHLLGKTYTSEVQTRISNALLVGSVIGILAFGFVADRFNRKSGMLVTSGLVVVGSLMSTLAFQVHGTQEMLWYLTVARGAAGVGVGGEYPTSSAAALEGSNEHFDSQRGPIQVLISTVMATSGSALCTFVYLMALIGSNENLEVAYHAIYAISTILPLFVVLARWRMQNGKLFNESNFQKRKIPWTLIVRKYWLRMLGTSAAFFLYDFVNL